MHNAGMFTAMVVGHGVTQSKTGTIQVAIKFETDEGRITGWFPMTDKSAEYSIEKLRNIGYHSDTLADLAGGECLVGRRCEIVVDHEKYDGKLNAKVKSVYPEGYEGSEIVSDEKAAENIRRFDALLHKAQKQDGKGPTSDIKDDDVPF